MTIQRVGRYEILSELGRGSMGRVYLSRDPNIDRRLAVKVFSPPVQIGAEEDEELRKRFLLEARAAGKLHHPGIVTIHDAGTDPRTGLAYIAMEWVEGSSLAELLSRHGSLPVRQTIAILSQVAAALDHAHGQDLVHRDVKPANILVDLQQRAKLTDFGVAKFVSLSHTMAGGILGTPSYMSPEQIKGESVDARSDLFSLGVCLYECLTGVVPFESDSLPAIGLKIISAEPRPPRSINSALPEPLSEVIDRALLKHADQRFQTGSEFARALEAAAPAAVRATAPGLPAAGGSTPNLPPLPVSTSAQTFAKTDPEAAAAPPTSSEATGKVGDSQMDLEEAPLLRHEEPVARRGRLRRWITAPLEQTPDRDRLRRWTTICLVPLAAALLVTLLVRQSGQTAENELPDEVGQTVATAKPAEIPLANRATESAELSDQDADPYEEGRTPGQVTAAPTSRPQKREELPTKGAQDENAPKEMTTAPTSRLKIYHKNRLRHADLSVWVDGKRLWRREMITSGFRKRLTGDELRGELSVPAGEHSVEIRITGVAGDVDVRESIVGSFVDGEEKQLKVSLGVRAKNLKLAWVE